jgi:hypothetical protein
MKKLFAFALIVFAASSAHADSPQGSTIWGAGMTSCGQYVSMTDQHEQLMIAVVGAWMQGYISSLNDFLGYQKKPPLRYVDPDSINAYAAKFCRDNPLKTVHSATLELISDLQTGK